MERRKVGVDSEDRVEFFDGYDSDQLRIVRVADREDGGHREESEQ